MHGTLQLFAISCCISQINIKNIEFEANTTWCFPIDILHGNNVPLYYKQNTVTKHCKRVCKSFCKTTCNVLNLTRKNHKTSFVQ